MAFGKGKTQPKGTNYCGGYALWAILVDSGKEPEEKTAPKEIYDAVQIHQRHSQQDGICDQSRALVEKMGKAGGGTAICLPSSLVKEARERGFSVSLHYSEGIAFEPEVIDDEVKRCNVETTSRNTEKDVQEVFSDATIDYYLVLVDNCHWIALKRKKKAENINKLSVYDPAIDTGKEDERPKVFPDEYNHVGSLVIALRLPVKK